jgi:Protein of unknown function (DUF3501)
MSKLTMQDIWPNPVYEAARSELRAGVIALKRDRRIQLTDEVTLVFENRETLRFQVQEILRIEGITSPEGIQSEVDVYNTQMPSAHALAATLFIEVTDEARIPEVLQRLLGIEEALWLRFPGGEVRASFEGGRSDGARISAVQYVQFRFDERGRSAFLASSRAELTLEHPAAKATVQLGPETLKSLKGDLTAG